MLWFKEKNPQDELEEMAGLRKTDTGLPVNLWLDDSSNYKRSGHWKRIKFQADYGNKVNPKNLVNMTLSENPEIFPPNVNVNLPAKDIELIKTFVRNNFKLLSKLADQEISFLEFAKQMKI